MTTVVYPTIDPATLRVTSGPLPGSRKVYLESRSAPGVRVAMREVQLTNGERVMLYDTSGPYTDPENVVDLAHGLPKLRRPWIEGRGDVERYAGRQVQPIDDGLAAGRAP